MAACRRSTYGGISSDHWHGGFYVNLQVVYGFFNPLGPVINNVRADHAARPESQLGARWWPPWSGQSCYLFFGYRIFKRFEVNFADIA